MAIFQVGGMRSLNKISDLRQIFFPKYVPKTDFMILLISKQPSNWVPN